MLYIQLVACFAVLFCALLLYFCLQNAYLQSFARVPPSEKQHHDQPWERARQRADAMLNRCV